MKQGFEGLETRLKFIKFGLKFFRALQLKTKYSDLTWSALVVCRVVGDNGLSMELRGVDIRRGEWFKRGE